jgi:hypothetical protein
VEVLERLDLRQIAGEIIELFDRLNSVVECNSLGGRGQLDEFNESVRGPLAGQTRRVRAMLRHGDVDLFDCPKHQRQLLANFYAILREAVFIRNISETEEPRYVAFLHSELPNRELRDPSDETSYLWRDEFNRRFTGFDDDMVCVATLADSFREFLQSVVPANVEPITYRDVYQGQCNDLDNPEWVHFLNQNPPDRMIGDEEAEAFNRMLPLRRWLAGENGAIDVATIKNAAPARAAATIRMPSLDWDGAAATWPDYLKIVAADCPDFENVCRNAWIHIQRLRGKTASEILDGMTAKGFLVFETHHRQKQVSDDVCAFFGWHSHTKEKGRRKNT